MRTPDVRKKRVLISRICRHERDDGRSSDAEALPAYVVPHATVELSLVGPLPIAA
jgi:hypothetical protein